MRTRIFTALTAGLAATTILLTACKKDSDKQTHLQIHMTDNPFDATEVNVDIKEVNVHFSDDDSDGWVSLNTRQGVYNLLDYQNGIDTVLADGLVPLRPLKEVRFVLGTDNSITIDNVTYPLTIPSGSQSGLKIKLNKTLSPSIDSLIIDFDAALSIHQTGTGEYKLQPVIKVKE